MVMGDESDQVSEGHLVNALACTGDEGRGTLRKAMGSCERALIRGYPNGATHLRALVRWERMLVSDGRHVLP